MFNEKYRTRNNGRWSRLATKSRPVAPGATLTTRGFQSPARFKGTYDRCATCREFPVVPRGKVPSVCPGLSANSQRIGVPAKFSSFLTTPGETEETHFEKLEASFGARSRTNGKSKRTPRGRDGISWRRGRPSSDLSARARRQRG